MLAIDNDDWSIANAEENIETNKCSLLKVNKIDSLSGVEGPFDVLLANINKHVILAEMGMMGQHLAAGGVILLSGLLEDDFKDVENEAIKLKYSISVRMTKGAWICLKLEKTKPQS